MRWGPFGVLPAESFHSLLLISCFKSCNLPKKVTRRALFFSSKLAFRNPPAKTRMRKISLGFPD